MVVNTESVTTAAGCVITVTGVGAGAEATIGAKGMLKHALIAKANIDETRETPGAHTPYPGGSMISQAASSGEAMAYLAGKNTTEFKEVLADLRPAYAKAITEIELMVTAAVGPKNRLQAERLRYSVAMLKAGESH